MSRSTDAAWYEPPGFPLLEAEPLADGAARRGLFAWNGLVGHPASDVLLSWSGLGGPVLVGTQRWGVDGPGDAELGAVMAWQAIDETLVAERVRDVIRAPDLLPWSTGGIRCDGRRLEVRVAIEGRWTLGAGSAGDRRFAFVLPSASADALRLRTVDAHSAADYDADPLRAWTLSAYRAARDRARPGA